MLSTALHLPIAVLIVGSGVLFQGAVRNPWLVQEDGLFESAGAALFLFAAILAIGRASVGGLLRKDRVLCLLIAPFALFLALSEISFGARMGWLTPPAMYGGGEFDGGHDIVILSLRLVRDFPHLSIPTALILVVGLVLAVRAIVTRSSVRIWLKMLQPTAMMQRFAVVVLALSAALLLDLLTSWKAGVLEEVIELIASILLCVAVSTRSCLVASTPQPTRSVLNVSRRHS